MQGPGGTGWTGHTTTSVMESLLAMHTELSTKNYIFHYYSYLRRISLEELSRTASIEHLAKRYTTYNLQAVHFAGNV